MRICGIRFAQFYRKATQLLVSVMVGDGERFVLSHHTVITTEEAMKSFRKKSFRKKSFPSKRGYVEFI